MYSFVQYEDSTKHDYVLPVRSHAKGEKVLVRSVREIKEVGLRPSGTKSHERRACPRSSGARNQVGGTSSIRYEVAKIGCLSSSILYEESSWQAIICSVRSRENGVLVLVHPVHGIKQVGQRPSGTKSRQRGACPRPSGTMNLGLVFECLVQGVKLTGFRSSDTKSHKMRACPCPSGTKSPEWRACLRPSGTRNQAGGTSSVRYNVV